MKTVNVIGAGLAGSEAAYQLSKRGIKVNLYEKKRIIKNEVQKLNDFAELVCSNTLRSKLLTNAVGALKNEMQLFDSLIIKAAYANEVPAGSALAVDRENFSRYITSCLENDPNINIIDQDYIKINYDQPTIIATGPLTSENLQQEIKQILGEEYFYFYDAVAPIITKESIDFSKAYYKSRYDKGEASYINCPMNETQYDLFYDKLINGETIVLKDHEKDIFFEGCMPIEAMAKRGKQSLLFGPLKPVGLEQTKDIKNHAVVQLRQDNAAAELYNLVGFQTNLKWPVQKEVIRTIPGLENANIIRYGVMHKNNFINSPYVLNKHLQLKHQPNIFFAGQITGVEGYVESCATGIIVAINIFNHLNSQPLLIFPKETVMGALVNYIIESDSTNFQPMKANYGILPNFEKRFKSKEEKYLNYSKRAIETMQYFIEQEKI